MVWNPSGSLKFWTVTLRRSPASSAGEPPQVGLADLRAQCPISGKPEIGGRRPRCRNVGSKGHHPGRSSFEAREDAGTSG